MVIISKCNMHSIIEKIILLCYVMNNRVNRVRIPLLSNKWIGMYIHRYSNWDDSHSSFTWSHRVNARLLVLLCGPSGRAHIRVIFHPTTRHDYLDVRAIFPC